MPAVVLPLCVLQRRHLRTFTHCHSLLNPLTPYPPTRFLSHTPAHNKTQHINRLYRLAVEEGFTRGRVVAQVHTRVGAYCRLKGVVVEVRHAALLLLRLQWVR